MKTVIKNYLSFDNLSMRWDQKDLLWFMLLFVKNVQLKWQSGEKREMQKKHAFVLSWYLTRFWTRYDCSAYPENPEEEIAGFAPEFIAPSKEFLVHFFGKKLREKPVFMFMTIEVPSLNLDESSKVRFEVGFDLSKVHRNYDSFLEHVVSRLTQLIVIDINETADVTKPHVSLRMVGNEIDELRDFNEESCGYLTIIDNTEFVEESQDRNLVMLFAGNGNKIQRPTTSLAKKYYLQLVAGLFDGFSEATLQDIDWGILITKYYSADSHFSICRHSDIDRPCGHQPSSFDETVARSHDSESDPQDSDSE